MQLQLEALGIIFEGGVIETSARKRVNIAESVTKLIIKKRTNDAFWQAGFNITGFFSDLIKKRGQFIGKHRVLRHEHHQRFTRARIRTNKFVAAGLHQFLFDAIGHLCRNFLRRGARPQGAHHHNLESKGRIFRLPKTLVTDNTCEREHDHDEQHQGAIIQRPGRQVEVTHFN